MRDPFNEFERLDRVAKAFADRLDAMTPRDWEDLGFGENRYHVLRYGGGVIELERRP